MSLIRQFQLLVLSVVLLALAGGVTVNVLSVRDALQTQLQLKNHDNAQALALALSQQGGDRELMGLLMAAQFDTGHYRSLRLLGADGAEAFARRADAAPLAAPAWFARLAAIEPAPGVAQVSDGWRPVGRVEVSSQVSFAHDALWRGAQRATAWLGAVGALAALLAGVAMRRIRRPLDATVEQARALEQGRYVTVDEPQEQELRRLSRAMNRMVERVRALVDAQTAQIEGLRRQAHCDPLTGLSHRAHFMERLGTMLHSEDGFDGGGLVLVRLADPAGLNRRHGRELTDRALLTVAHTLQAYPQRAPECVAGRLNGSDFALVLPAAGLAEETARSIAQALQSNLGEIAPAAQVHLGAVELTREAELGALMARADLALARAENRGAFAVEVEASNAPASGERTWQAQVEAALHQGRVQLVEFPVLDRQRRLSHLECPLRMQLVEGGEYEPAARWLPLAQRARLLPLVDGHAVELALAAIAHDARPRGVNLAAASLADGGFVAHLRHRLQQHPQAARQLWLEVSERTALEHFDTLQEFARLVRPLGVRLGLEHAGERLGLVERLFELGLDYVKLDAALVTGVASSLAARDFVHSTVALLHAMALQVHAEGVHDAADAEVLWSCGIDAITGPWASAS